MLTSVSVASNTATQVNAFSTPFLFVPTASPTSLPTLAAVSTDGAISYTIVITIITIITIITTATITTITTIIIIITVITNHYCC